MFCFGSNSFSKPFALFFALIIFMGAASAGSVITAVANDTDTFYSPYPSNSVINLIVTADTSGSPPDVVVQANFTNITTLCGSSGYVNLTNNSGTWTGSCDVSAQAASSDFVGGYASVYLYSANSSTVVSAPLIIQPIILYNMTVPSMGGDPCNSFGPLTTNMSTVQNFNTVNFIVEIQHNGSSLCNGQLIWPGSRQVMLMNFTSLNMSNETVGQRLANLASAINVSVVPPHSFGQSRVYVNSTAFAELNSNATLVFSNLPFTAQPSISKDNTSQTASAQGWASAIDPYLNSSLGNLTFSVSGFSGYNVSDAIAPSITIQSPASGATLGYSSVLVNLSSNGTGSEISFLSINVTNASNGAQVNYTSYTFGGANTANCSQSSNGSEILNCGYALSLENGNYSIAAVARDFGGSSGNQNATVQNFTVYVDTIPPGVILISPSNASTLPSAPAFRFNATDDFASALSCSLYIDSLLSGSNSSVLPGAQSSIVAGGIADGSHAWQVNCSDGTNSNVSAAWQFVLDTAAPSVSIAIPIANSILNNSTSWLNFTAIDTNSGVNSSACQYAQDGGARTSIPSCNNLTLPVLSSGAHTIVVYAKDNAGNEGGNGISFTVDVSGNSTTIPLNNTTNVAANNSQIVVTPYSPPANITTTANATNVTLNVTSYNGTTYNATLPAMTIDASTGMGDIIVQIPDGTVVNSTSDWGGIIRLPTVLSNSSASPSVSGYTTTVTGVVEIGSPSVQVTLSRGVRIVIPDATGKRVGYQLGSGAFTEITAVCPSDSQAAGDALAAGADCKYDTGVDMVIWTKHFTKFASFTATATGGGSTGGSSSGGNNGGGGAGGSSGGTLKNSTKYVIDNGKANCTIEVERSIISSTTLSIMTTTLSNLGGSECALYDFLMSDTVPSNFAAITEIKFTPSYSTREGWGVGFSFPTFEGGESKTISYSVNAWVPPSRVKNFTNLVLSARKDATAPKPVTPATTPAQKPPAKPKQNATVPPVQATAEYVVTKDQQEAAPGSAQSELGKPEMVLTVCGGVSFILIAVAAAYLFIKRRRRRGLEAV